ncbi:hypothetical protein G6F63_016891 [Rhizopus arrhizus]|nr:hypothetical protein G6F63_016891 [Rhizopus arrhizus]
MGDPLCRPDDAAARLLRGHVCDFLGQRGQVPDHGRRAHRRLRWCTAHHQPGAGRQQAGAGRRLGQPVGDQVRHQDRSVRTGPVA